MSACNVKREPESLQSSPRKSKRRVSGSPTLQNLMNDLSGTIKTEKHRHRHTPQLLGGAQEETPEDTDTAPKVKKERSKSERKIPDDEVSKLKSKLKKYEATIYNLAQRLKSEEAAYQKGLNDLQETNNYLREEVARVQDQVEKLTEQKEMEQNLVAKLKGDNSHLSEKNVQLEEDLAKMVQNIQHSDKVLQDLRDKLAEKDNERMSLSTERKYLVQQLEDMRRMSMTSGLDSFAPPAGGDGRRTSLGSNYAMSSPGCCQEGLLGWMFGHGRGSLSRIFILAFLLTVCLGYVFQAVLPASASGPAECDYEMEMFSSGI